MTPLNRLPAHEIARMIRAGEVRPSEVMRAHLDQIAKREDAVGAFIHFVPEAAMERARAADARPATGILHGVPFAIKDIFDTENMPTGWGSEIYVERRPKRNAHFVQTFLDAGAIPIGKTVTTEFAYFRPGKTANPNNLAHTPGGSSSGSAAAVADGMAPLALGSQTAASLIRPAAYCGACAYKPTTGTADMTGVMALSPSLDSPGVLTRDPRDLTLARAALTRTRASFPDFGPDFEDDLPRIGLMRGPHWWEGEIAMRDTCTRALAAIAATGADTYEIAHPPIFADLTPAQITVMGYEAARSRVAEYAMRDRISPEFVALIEDGQKVAETDYRAALATRDRANAIFNAMFSELDALIVPSAPGPAPKGLAATGDPLFSRMWSLLGLPCAALPFGADREGLPLGIQLIAPKQRDRKLLNIASWIHDILRHAEASRSQAKAPDSLPAVS